MELFFFSFISLYRLRACYHAVLWCPMKRFASILSAALYSVAAGLFLGLLASLVLAAVNLIMFPHTLSLITYSIEVSVFYGACIMVVCCIAYAAAESLEG